MRLILAALLAGHGIAHLPGFAVSWKLLSSPDLPYRTAVLGDLVEIGDAGARVAGVLWLLMAAVFLGLAVAASFDTAGWRSWAQVGIAGSILLCAIGWPDARLGLIANAVIGLLVWVSLP